MIVIKLSIMKEIKMKNDTNKQKINAVFFHDFKYIKTDNSIFGDGQFEYNYLWKRYLKHFNKLFVVARISHNSKDNRPLSILNGKNVFFPTISYTKPTDFFLNFKKIKNEISEVIDNNDIAFVRLPSILGLFACHVLNKKQKPYVIEVVGDAFSSLWYFHTIKGKFFAPILYIINRFYIYKANNVIYVTSQYLQKLYPNKKNTLSCSDVLIKNLNISVLHKRTHKIELEPRNLPLKIGLVGSLDVMYKGHFDAIKIARKIDGKAELHFLGSGDRKKWIELSKKNKLSIDLIFDSSKNPGSEMDDWYDSMDILILPSKTEGMPRVVLEAMSRGCTVIAYDVGDVKTVIPKEYVVTKGKWRAIAAIINGCYYNREILLTNAQYNFKTAKK